MAGNPLRPSELFSSAERRAIRSAAAEAETRTSGEIVPFVVGRCDPYPGAAWTGAALGALAAAALAGLSYVLAAPWQPPSLALISVPSFVGAALGFLAAARSNSLARALIGESTLERRTRLRAEAAFLEESVFQTRERTGILIFLALFEHRAVVLADEGINAQVAQDEWQHIVDDLAAGIKADRAAEAMVEAIQACGKLLEERRVLRRDDDEDELSDALRIRDN